MSPSLIIYGTCTVAILTAFGVSFVLFRRFGTSKHPLRRFWFWFSGVVGSLVLYLMAVTAWVLYLSYVPSRPFDREEWLKASAERREMVDDLMASKALDGISRSDVVALLGPPDSVSYFVASNRDMIYYLGNERHRVIQIDSEWLLIWLKEGRVDHYKLATD